MPNDSLTPERAREYWRRTSNLMWVMLAIWFLAGFVVHMFAPALNQVTFFGFPLAFYMAGQGSLLIFVIAVFWYARQQNRIDEDFDVNDE